MYSNPAQFDSEGNMVDTQGNIMVPSHVVEQYISGMQRSGQYPAQFRASDLSGYPLPPTLANFAQTTPRHLSSSPQSHSHGPSHSRLSSSHLASPASPAHHARNGIATTAQPSLAIPRAPNNNNNHNRAHSTSSSISSSNAYGVTAPPHPDAYSLPASAAPGASPGWLPQEFPSPSIATAALGIDRTFQPAVEEAGAWLPPSHRVVVPSEQPGPAYDQSHPSPLRPRNPTPSIRVTTSLPAPAHDFSQPQDAIASASSASSLPPHDFHAYHKYHPAHLSPHAIYPMPQDTENMQMPASPVSGHNSPHEAAIMTADQQQLSRKRSHSIMSQQDTQMSARPHQHSRSGSIASAGVVSPNENDEPPYSPRGSRAFKRVGDPPTNAAHKYICDFAEECTGLVFDRKCEWSKHMDKHDRPYRCPHPSCAKLQGFTYSGGLLRHEREVHGKHGGPRSQLMCPHPECKRHSGKGFTRKENLNEHLRRVHPQDLNSQMSQVSTLRRDGTDVGSHIMEGETPASRMSETQDHDEYGAPSPVLGKRKRAYPDGLNMGDGVEDKDEELKRLRVEAGADKHRMYEMEERLREQEAHIAQLSATLLQYQQSQQGHT